MAMRRLLLFAVLAGLAAAGMFGSVTLHHARAGGETGVGEPAWTQFGPDGLFARTITTHAACPAVLIDGRLVAMTERVGPADGFPNRVCDAPIPAATRSLSVHGRPLPLPVAEPTRIAVIGDTGCRLKGERFQACNDPAAFPLATINASIAREGAQLIIHVGDYYYREAACPAGNAGCAGSPHGDNWDSWNADWFTPATASLAAAPWIYLRGDHETCERGGRGWKRYLDPTPYTEACVNHSDPYIVRAGSTSMLVMDGSGASDFQVNQADVARYREQLTSLRRAAGPEAWLLVHQPLWTVGNANPPGREPNLFFGNPNLLAAIEPLLPYPVRQVVSGHQHIFVALGAAGRPAQLVVGQGGTMLDDPVPTPLPPGLLSGGARIDDARFILEFGYMVLNRTNDGWTGLVRDTHGRTISTCTLPSSGVTCTP